MMMMMMMMMDPCIHASMHILTNDEDPIILMFIQLRSQAAMCMYYEEGGSKVCRRMRKIQYVSQIVLLCESEKRVGPELV